MLFGYFGAMYGGEKSGATSIDKPIYNGAILVKKRYQRRLYSRNSVRGDFNVVRRRKWGVFY